MSQERFQIYLKIVKLVNIGYNLSILFKIGQKLVTAVHWLSSFMKEISFNLPLTQKGPRLQ